MRIHRIIFSPTGGTARVSEYLCEGMGGNTVVTDLCMPDRSPSYQEISSDDIVVVAMPVFAGRVPSLAVERLRKIHAAHARCVLVAVYGNRAYDDALLEMYDVATDMGLRVIAAVSAVAEHSIVREYGAGRPDKADRNELYGFGKAVLHRIECGDVVGHLNILGNRPYRNPGKGPFPMADDNCTSCGKCAALCPAGAIHAAALRGVDKDVCISCMRCVAVCPSHSRNIGATQTVLAERLKPLCAERKANVLIM